MTKSESAPDRGSALDRTELRKRPVALVGLMATVGLALSTIVAVTAVSIGIARTADIFGIRAAGEPAHLAIALMAMLLLAIGGLSALMADHSEKHV
jgi:hypothetical protein